MFKTYFIYKPTYPGAPYSALTLPSPYDSICSSYPGSGYPSYQQSYSCLTPYPSTTFSTMSPYQVHKDGGKRNKMNKRQTEMMKEYDENEGLETHVDKFEKKT